MYFFIKIIYYKYKLMTNTSNIFFKISTAESLLNEFYKETSLIKAFNLLKEIFLEEEILRNNSKNVLSILLTKIIECYTKCDNKTRFMINNLLSTYRKYFQNIFINKDVINNLIAVISCSDCIARSYSLELMSYLPVIRLELLHKVYDLLISEKAFYDEKLIILKLFNNSIATGKESSVTALFDLLNENFENIFIILNKFKLKYSFLLIFKNINDLPIKSEKKNELIVKLKYYIQNKSHNEKCIIIAYMIFIISKFETSYFNSLMNNLACNDENILNACLFYLNYANYGNKHISDVIVKYKDIIINFIKNTNYFHIVYFIIFLIDFDNFFTDSDFVIPDEIFDGHNILKIFSKLFEMIENNENININQNNFSNLLVIFTQNLEKIKMKENVLNRKSSIKNIMKIFNSNLISNIDHNFTNFIISFVFDENNVQSRENLLIIFRILEKLNQNKMLKEVEIISKKLSLYANRQDNEIKEFISIKLIKYTDDITNFGINDCNPIFIYKMIKNHFIQGKYKESKYYYQKFNDIVINDKFTFYKNFIVLCYDLIDLINSLLEYWDEQLFTNLKIKFEQLFLMKLDFYQNKLNIKLSTFQQNLISQPNKIIITLLQLKNEYRKELVDNLYFYPLFFMKENKLDDLINIKCGNINNDIIKELIQVFVKYLIVYIQPFNVQIINKKNKDITKNDIKISITNNDNFYFHCLNVEVFSNSKLIKKLVTSGKEINQNFAIEYRYNNVHLDFYFNYDDIYKFKFFEFELK